ncbi:ATP-dependent DNA helicase PIF1 [Artemisia annua]|uniref:ATP-dependent DNA helicase PIF1 n=1 Tax=Artemisia annua TaxID=35608 RepID=A0A2U1NEH5_ARTAN|nr:ATP-dependent DNA helicase PIF1 [Artemisia annua]
MAGSKSPNGTNEEESNKSSVPPVIGTKTIQDDDVPVPVTKKRRRLLKNGKFISNQVLGSVPSDPDLEEGVHQSDHETDDEKPMRIKRTNKDTQTNNSKKRLFKIIDSSTDDDQDEAKYDSVDLKAKEVGPVDDKLIDHSNDHVYHLDDISDDEHFLDEQNSLVSKDKKCALIDEESDEHIHNKTNTTNDGLWVNINDLPREASHDLDIDNNYIHDEAEEDLQGSDIYSVSSISDGDDKDSFIDDESPGEYIEGIKEAAHWSSAEHLRDLFVTLLSQKELETPLSVWLQTWHLLAEDVEYKRSILLGIPGLRLCDDEKKNVCLFFIEQLMRSRGTTLKRFPEMPYPDDTYMAEFVIKKKVLVSLLIRYTVLKDFIDFGRITSIRINDRDVDSAKKGQQVSIKPTDHVYICQIDGSNVAFKKDFKKEGFCNHISRNSINVLKEHYLDELSREEKALVNKLKKIYKIR